MDISHCMILPKLMASKLLTSSLGGLSGHVQDSQTPGCPTKDWWLGEVLELRQLISKLRNVTQCPLPWMTHSEARLLPI